MSNDTRQKLADLLDKRMLEALENGQEVMDQKTGELVRIPPTPAMLTAVMKRLEQLGVGDAPVFNTPAGELTEKVHAFRLRKTGTDGPLSASIEEFDTK